MLLGRKAGSEATVGRKTLQKGFLPRVSDGTGSPGPGG